MRYKWLPILLVALFICSGIGVAYEQPAGPVYTSSDSTYDLVIIAPKEFSRLLLPLVNHKNAIGIRTTLETTEEIYAQYDGRDKPEQIKYFIKDALEAWDISYVLLVGGKRGQRNTWYIPPRYSNLDDWSDWDYHYLSDLYYADIYKADGTFEDWDSNGNGIFAEWSRDSEQKDVLDLRPDVSVGRLACRNKLEVYTVVNKIITYETQTAGKPWFTHMIVAGGDTFPNPYDEYEGEMEVKRSAMYMDAVVESTTFLFASDETLTRRTDLIRELNKGAGFVHLAGHGTPSIWSTHPPHDMDTWIDGIGLADMLRLRNRNKLPIYVIGGCHTHKFDVTVQELCKGVVTDGLHYFSPDREDYGAFWLFEWVPECIGWQLVSLRHGGAIATIGNTGLGYGTPGNSTLDGLGGWLEPRFFHAIGIQGKTTLGEAHGQALIDYIDRDGVDVNKDRIDRKTVEQWVLLGDPSLKIGGYAL